jgi:branched-chain amino acid transport system permease protein
VTEASIRGALGGRFASRALAPKLGLLVLGVVAMVVAPSFVSLHYEDLLVQAFIYAIFAISFDLLWGYTGVLSLGHSAFFGVGGYVIGVSATQLGTGTEGIVVGIVCGVLGAVLLAVLVGWVTFYSRVTPIYIAVITLSLALVLSRLAALTSFTPLSDYTGGYNGLSFILSSWPISNWYWLCGGALVVFTLLALVLVNSDFGRVLIGIRDNERRLAYLGYDVPRVKLFVFTISAAVAALAGAAYASYLDFASPDLLGITVATNVLIIVSIGGRGTIVGPVIGAIVIGLVGPTVSDRWPEYWQLVLGLVFVAIVIFLPHGLYGALKQGAGAIWRRTSWASDDAVSSGARLVQTAWSGDRERQAAGDASRQLARFEGVSKSFGSLHVLRGVNLGIYASEILCLIGPNGAGKSTLINMVTDTRDLTGGDVFYDGARRNGLPPAKIARLGVGRTFQGTNLMETYTVADSLFIAHRRGRIPSLWRRTSDVPVNPEVAALDAATGLAEVLDVRVADLSHGKRQALELSLALALEPVVLLLDEPTAGLTEEERAIVGPLLRQLAQGGIGVVLVEHDLDFVRAITDRVAVLHQGKVEVEGPVEEVVGSTLVREIYLGVK